MQKYAKGTTLVSLNSLFPKKNSLKRLLIFRGSLHKAPSSFNSLSLSLLISICRTSRQSEGQALSKGSKSVTLIAATCPMIFCCCWKAVVPGHHEECFLMLPSGLPRRLTGPPVLWIAPPAKQRMNRMAQLAEPMASWPWMAKNSFVVLKGDHASQRRRKRIFYIHEREKGNKKIGDGKYNKAISTCYNLWNVMPALIQFWPSSAKQSTFRKIAPSNQTSHNKKVRRTWYGKAITSKVPDFENCWLVLNFARKTVLFQVQNMEGMCVCVLCVLQTQVCCTNPWQTPTSICARKQPWTKKQVEPSTNCAPSKNFAPSYVWCHVVCCNMNEVMWLVVRRREVKQCSWLQDIMWCDVMWCDMTWCDVMWYGVMYCDVMCDVMWGDVMWRDAMWGEVLPCDVLYYHVRSDVMSWNLMWSDAMGWDVLWFWCSAVRCEDMCSDAMCLFDTVNWEIVLWLWTTKTHDSKTLEKSIPMRGRTHKDCGELTSHHNDSGLQSTTPPYNQNAQQLRQTCLLPVQREHSLVSTAMEWWQSCVVLATHERRSPFRGATCGLQNTMQSKHF